jgi:hypothetical protein
LGVSEDGKEHYIFNHLAFNVLVHRTHGEYTRAQKNSPYASGLVMDPSGRRLLTADDSTNRRMLAWPEGTPETLVEALKQRSSRTLQADEEVRCRSFSRHGYVLRLPHATKA